ncbi:MAG: NUDIX domain-containing protein [Fervidobacterium sp.]|nr:NUDIX domain-containing protein [Fervidobacterium sp.]
MDYQTLINRIKRSDKQKLAVICYAKYKTNFLFMKRKNEPFAGFLVPPGGKVESHESVQDAIQREFIEETGLKPKNLQLRMITSEIGPDKYNWILFIFSAELDSMNVINCEEGELVWINEKNLFSENLSPIDKLLIPHIFTGGLKIAYIDYSNNKEVSNLKIFEIEQFLNDQEKTH